MRKFWLGLGFLGLVIDQVIKIFFISSFEAVNNLGVSFGLGSGFDWKWLLVLLLLVFWVWFRKNDYSYLVVFGGVSNLIDRFRLGFVVDYFEFYLDWFKFNLADGLIVLGVIGLIYNQAYGDKKDI